MYQTFAKLAAEICETPMALVSLVDSSRQWFKANVGLPDVSETPREISFCTHAVASQQMLEVPDAALDPRFAENPLVVGAPNIRFYAGAPLIDTNGFALGTLCALDRRPRVLSDRQRAALSDVARGLTSLIEARRGVSPDGLRQLALLSNALDAAPDPIAIVRVRASGIPVMFTFANRAFVDLFGYSLTEIVGQLAAILAGPKTDPSRAARLQDAADRGEPGTELLTVYDKSGTPLIVDIRDRPIDAMHRIVGFRDLTRLASTQRALTATNQRLSSLLAHNNDAVLSVDRFGKCTDANRAAEKLLGFPCDQLIGFDLTTLRGTVFPDGDAIPNAFASGTTFEFTTTYPHREGRTLHLECKAVPMIVSGTIEGAYVIAKDVTERRRITDLVTEQATRTHALYVISSTKANADAEQIDAALELAIRSLDMDCAFVGEVQSGTFVMKNCIGDRVYPVGHALELSHTHIASTLATGDVLAFEDLHDHAADRPDVTSPAGWHGYIAAPLAVDGERSGAIGLISHKRVAFTDFDIQFVRLVASLVSTLLERQHQQQRLDRLAYYDNLTGLPNRAHFMRALASSIASAGEHATQFALHSIDLDGFKMINDGAGHAVGDLALREVGRRLQHVIRSSDMCARLGGDEFVVLQADVAQVSDVSALGRRLMESLAEPYLLESVAYRMTGSIGVAIYPFDGNDENGLLREADAALYRAKDAGKNRLEFGGDAAAYVTAAT